MKKIWMILTLAVAGSLFGKDIYQWRGNDRTGVYPETGLLKSWPEEGPKMLWANEDVASGYSAGSIVGDKIYVMGTLPDKKTEQLSVLDRATGKTLWTLEYGSAWDKSFQDARTMPCVIGDNVYLTSGAGEVVCIDAKNKVVKWKYDAAKEFDGRPLAWGYGENVLVWKDKVFFTVGGDKTSIIAIDSKKGELVWKSKSLGKRAAYVSPIMVEFGGKPMLIGGIEAFMFGVNPENGEIMWSKSLERLAGKDKGKTWEINCATPVYSKGRVFVTAGYDQGGYMLEIERGGRSVKEVWNAPEFDNHHGGAVLLNGKLYGANWHNNEKGNWVCYEWNSGKEIYNEEWDRHSKGSIVSADGMLYIYEEKRGDIALANPKSGKFDIVSSFKVPLGSGRNWCHIVVCDGVMYVRHGNVLMAFDVKAK